MHSGRRKVETERRSYIEGTQIGQCKMYTKLRFSSPHRATETHFQAFHAQREKPFAFHFNNILKAFPILSYALALINN